MNYTFFITTPSSIIYQVYPLNWLDCSLVWEKDRDEMFYRQKFEGSLTFGGKKLCADFDLLYAQEIFDPCGEVYLLIMKGLDIYWEGYFSTSMGEWDMDNHTFTVTPLVIDDYTDFDDAGDDKYNMITCVTTTRTSNMVYNGVTYAFDRCRYLIDFIKYIASDICGATVTSSFLNGANNYVTLETNHYNLLTIAQKSDIKRWNSTNPATVAEMSWNELMTMLKCMNLYWTYNITTNIVTIEHISWTGWAGTAGADIRTQEIALANNKYSYLKEDLPKWEKFNWMESSNDEFTQGVIWYDSRCVDQNSSSNTKEYSFNVTTDIQYICDCIEDVSDEGLISNISDEGFVLLANYFDGPNLKVWMTNRPMGNTYFNCDLSWGILLLSFFKHERAQIEGYVNGILTTFYTSRKTKKQDTVMICCDEFDPIKYITTELGETYFNGMKGYVKTATMQPDELIKLELVYGEEENENTGFSHGKGMIITEVKTTFPDNTRYTAVLTEPADALLTMKIEIILQDSDTPPMPFASGYYDLDILLGTTTGFVDIPWGDPGVSPYRILIHHWDPTGIGTWNYSVIYDPAAQNY
jgi:hypothetical protein